MPEIRRNEQGKLDAYAWPGGYPLFYTTQDCGKLCPACANGENGSIAYVRGEPAKKYDDPQWCMVAVWVNWELSGMYCDHCNKRIESAYAEDQVQDGGGE